jgi:hypothetical protein
LCPTVYRSYLISSVNILSSQKAKVLVTGKKLAPDMSHCFTKINHLHRDLKVADKARNLSIDWSKINIA